MKVRVLEQVHIAELEKRIETFLFVNEDVSIKHISQSQSDDNYVNVTILYE